MRHPDVTRKGLPVAFPVELHFFAEHHGKGRVDGHFGVCAQWLRDHSRRKTINSPELLFEAFDLGGRVAMRDNEAPQMVEGDCIRSIHCPRRLRSVKHFYGHESWGRVI